MHFFHSKPDRRTNEGVFFAYYSRLLEWAAQITRNDRAEAEDLVHDLYLRVTRITRPIDDIEQLEHYLFTVLRNLYYARLRRAGHDPIDDLSITDYDSVEQGLAAADRRELLFVRDHLRQVCRYACERKSEVRSASVLILRFFHGYYPTELMKILQTSRSSVDKLLQVARGEARFHLERPDALRSISSGAKPSVSLTGKNDDTQDLFTELRESIFSAVEGDCFEQTALKQRYAEGSQAAGLTTPELSHLVSCKVCLDRVNRILQLPLLADRSPEDGIDRDSPSGPGGEGGRGITPIRKRPSRKGPDIRKMERRARDLYEHRPRNLEIVVDGDVRSSQKVTAEINEFRLKLARKEEPAFIQVLSEQGFCLAFLLVEMPASADKLEQAETISLSDGRSLALTLSFATEYPTVHVVYRDPVMAEEAAVKPMAGGVTADVTKAPAEGSTKAIILRPPNRLLRWAGTVFTRFANGFKRFFVNMMNPMLATSLVCGVAAVVLLVLSLRTASVMKPSELLQRATVAENAAARSGASGVVVQSVVIQTRQRKMERTLYRDIQRKRRLKYKALSQQDASLRTELEDAGISWNDPLSAGSFRDWHDGVAVQRDIVQRPEKGLLTLTTTVSAGRIASESLTVREADFHPVKRTVELRDAGTVEVAELNYSVLPWSSVNPDLFEPISDVGSAFGANAHPAILPHLPYTLSAVELDEAELGARLVLSRLHLDSNDRLQLVRQPMGVRVQGVVDDDDEKRQVQAQLYMVPHVSASILTIEEMAAQPAVASDVTSIRQSSAATTPEPSALEKYLADRGVDRTTASVPVHEFVQSSFAVNRESEQINDLLNRFASSAALSDAARTELSELLIQHKAALLDALGREERQLMTLQLVPHSSSGTGNPSGDGDALVGTAQHNLALCAELTSESNPSSRSAEQIAPQLESSITQLRAVVLRISAAAQLTTPSTGSPVSANQNK